MESTAPKRRRPRVSLRAFMLLVLVVGAWMGWQVSKVRRQREAVAAVKKYGGWVHYDWEIVNGKITKGTEPHAPKWLRKLLGDEFFQEIAYVSLVYDDSTGTRFDITNLGPADDVLARLSDITSLKSLLMQGTQATDDGLKQIRGLVNLEDLYIWESVGISDVGLSNLRNLKNLKNIHIDQSKITDEGFLFLKGNTRMEHLVLEGHRFTDKPLAIVEDMKQLSWFCVGGSQTVTSDITDDGLVHIRNLGNLTNINLSYTKVTDSGLDHLKNLKKLRILSLEECDITDQGLRSLSGLTSLQWLLLRGSRITDQGLEHLTSLTKLQLLDVDGTRVTDEGKRKFVERMAKYTTIR